MFSIIFKIYLLYVLSIIIHEFFHILTAVLLKKKINGIFIGENLYLINYKILHISPIVNGAHIEINVDQLERMNKIELIFFFTSGILGNIILLIISMSIHNLIFQTCLLFINLVAIIISAVPWINKTNDISVMIKYYRKLSTK